MADRQKLLPRVDFPGMRLGRHVNHDPRSLRFLVGDPRKGVTPKSVKHERHVRPFNQGELGTCVPNTGFGILATDPYWDTLPPELQRALADTASVQHRLVLPLYRTITRLDPFPGEYEPEDTGSDGLSLAKGLQADGRISGYQHATSLAGAHEAIQKGPFAAGVPWTQDMFNPTREGIVRFTGAVAGGHEIEFEEYDLSRDLWWATNSWTEQWGVNGRFAVSSETLQQLLANEGDITSFVPSTAPAPTPTPGPVSPIPAPTDPLADFPYAKLDTWAASQRAYWTRAQKDAAGAYTTWRNAHR